MIELRPDDPGYPARLRDLARPPDPLWVEGDPAVLARDALAVVGTRRMTPYGERVARELASAAAAAGLVVVSGLAQGIDSAAHAGALDAGGASVAVLGEGLGSFDPHGRRRVLAARLRRRGCVVSEYPPLAGAQTWTFARRNATIAALARAVVVVEAPHGSGALITAAEARRIGRGVYAVPGPIGSAASAGTNALIASGLARAVEGPETLGLWPTSPRADPLLDRLAAGPLSPDALGVGAERIAELLLRGDVVALPDGRLAIATR
ncbi:MAG TPA: DNA-processing protein DprA [Candidatus Limnocylindria bacterium]|nr:DNA-processing protein DprA [Candidatus Limnocylindria bacterium]